MKKENSERYEKYKKYHREYYHNNPQYKKNTKFYDYFQQKYWFRFGIRKHFHRSDKFNYQIYFDDNHSLNKKRLKNNPGVKSFKVTI
ncbi:hypothetical protein LCGC14_0454100 [marine sediment metagenome]|uniref:Uncharacterized protein n=1 Tax=marine sediment metagenome TaxID=412755 RepID=A0A0F9SH01_9ZZZZ